MKTNFWETELRKIFQNSATLEDLRFTGRIAVGRLSETENVKLSFASTKTDNQCDGIEVAIINRKYGRIDGDTFLFEDIIGKVAQTDNGKEFTPYIWDTLSGAKWHGYQPTPADYEKILSAVDDYLEIFQEPTQSMQQSQSM